MTALLTPQHKTHRLTVPVAIETKILDSAQGIVQALVSVSGNRDSDGDVVVPGATAYGLQLRNPKGVWHHDWTTPIAKTIEAVDVMPGDPSLPGDLLASGFGACRVIGQYNMDTDAAKAREAFSNVKFYEAEQQYSVGYEVHEWFVGGGGVEEPEAVSLLMGASANPAYARRTKQLLDDERPTRFITKWVLYEWSPVLWGANDLGRTEDAKSASTRERIELRLNGKGDGMTSPHTHGVIGDGSPTANSGTATAAPYDVALLDTEKALAWLQREDGDDRKAGRIQARRNVDRLRRARSAIEEILGELAAEEDDGKGAKSEHAEALLDLGVELGTVPSDWRDLSLEAPKAEETDDKADDEADPKDHEFEADGDHPRRCRHCSAGRNRPWHTNADKGDESPPAGDADDDEGKGLDERALMAFSAASSAAKVLALD